MNYCRFIHVVDLAKPAYHPSRDGLLAARRNDFVRDVDAIGRAMLMARAILFSRGGCCGDSILFAGRRWRPIAIGNGHC